MASYRSLALMCTLLLVLFALPMTAAAQQTLGAQERASVAINEGRYSEALSILRTIITPDSQNAQAFLLRAQAYEGREEYGHALNDYQRALDINPNLAAARQGVNRIRQRQNALASDKLRNLRRLVTAQPENMQFRLQYAEALYDAAMFRESAEQYAEYLERTQGTPDIVRRYLIAIASYEGDNDLGERVAAEYLQFYPTDHDLYMRLGYFRLWQGNNAGAIQAFEQSLRLHPNNTEAQRGLAEARKPGGQEGPSTYPIDVLVRELAANPNMDAKRFELVDLLIEARRYFEAQQNLAVLKTRHAEDPSWQRLNTLVEQRLAQAPQQATGPSDFIVDRLYRDLKKNPNQPEKRFRLAKELVTYKRYAEAYDQLLLLADDYDDTERWLNLFVQVDDGFIRKDGTSPIFPVDRLTYRLKAQPANVSIRYSLVDALIDAGRFAEAGDVLAEGEYLSVKDERYQMRLRAITEARVRLAQQNIVRLESLLAASPDNMMAMREIVDHYVVAGQMGNALAMYDRLVERDPTNKELRYRRTELLRVNGRADEALDEAALLVQSEPGNPRYQRLYALASISAGDVDGLAEQYLFNAIETNPQDTELLLDFASYRLSQGRIADAEELLARARATAAPAYTERITTLALLMERESIRAEQASHMAILNDARRLVAAKRYRAAIDRYEDYFTARGKRTRNELRELAQVYAAMDDYTMALSILDAIQEQSFDYEIAKEIARYQYHRKDYAGAAQTLEGIRNMNRNDYEVLLLLGDTYRELKQFNSALTVYEEAKVVATDARIIDARINDIELTASGDWRGFDFAGIIVPTSDATVARGGGTHYDRWAQGLQTQVTLPIGAVLTVGVNSHFLSGTRRLVPNSEVVRGRVNQAFAGGYLDLTPPMRSLKSSYTNRLSAEFGLFDYEGGRTVPFGGGRYWHQNPGQYTFSAGIRSTEGSIALWSPGGGEFNLRLTQFDVRASTASVLPDSLLRLNGTVAFNVVRDNFGSTANASETNFGTNIQLDAGYRILRSTYLGATFYMIDYRSTVDIYFSPRRYETYDFWLEYEKEVSNRWYWRVRGSMGLVKRSNGFVSRRLESDFIYRIARKLSLTLSSSIGQSTRSLGSGATAFEDQYNTFLFSGALYWTL